jgi:hypothetical protein
MIEKANWQPILTPYLAVLFVVLFFAKMLSPFLSLSEVASTLFIGFGIITCVFGLMYRIQKKKLVKASVLTSILIILFSFKNVLIMAFKSISLSLSKVISDNYLNLFYFIVFLACIVFLYFLMKNFTKIVTLKFIVFLNTSFLVLPLFELYNIYTYANGYHNTHTATVSRYLNMKTEVSKLALSAKDSLPDVYWFILDEHIGFDKSKEALNFDNQDLLKFLTDRKFSVATNAQSSYRETGKCIAAILNIKPLPPVFKDVTKGWINSSITSLYLKQMINKSFFSQIADNHWTIKNFSFFDIADVEKFYRVDEVMSTYSLKEYLFLELFRIRSLRKFNQHNKHVLDNIPTDTPYKGKASFNYIHLLMPHNPLFYDEDGKFYPDGNRENREGYISYVKYTDKKIQKIIDDTQRQNPKAVIIVMGDHGNRGDFCKDCAFSPLFAIYLPHKKNISLPQNFNTINTFKIILNEYFGQNLAYDSVSDSLNIQ